MIVTFCGHRDTPDGPVMRNWLYETVEKQIARGADLFYLGGYGAFDRMAVRTLWLLKREFPQIQSVLVLPYLNRRVDAKLYDDTTYPPLEVVPRRFAIVRRNQWMVDRAELVIACVGHDWGGAAAMLSYAVKKKKEVINYYS